MLAGLLVPLFPAGSSKPHLCSGLSDWKTEGHVWATPSFTPVLKIYLDLLFPGAGFPTHVPEQQPNGK